MTRFSTEVERVFLLALHEANLLGHSRIEPQHLLLGLARAKGELSRKLYTIGLSLERLRVFVGQDQTPNTNELPTYSETTRQLVKIASGLAKDKVITPKTLLLAITQQPHTQVYAILKATGELDRLFPWLAE
jgi:ATP-dependent Clp protease ATP-binding subunit ClpA